jgi:hypothetical protein
MNEKIRRREELLGEDRKEEFSPKDEGLPSLKGLAEKFEWT